MSRTLASAKALPLGVEVQIPLGRILHDDTMTRPLDEDKVKGLMASFRSKGQQQAIKVHPAGDWSFKVTFGEHRTEAARRLGWKEIRGVIENTSVHETLELKVTENAHRNGFVDPWEEGKIFYKLLGEKYDHDVNALADSLGKSPGYVNDRVTVHLCLAQQLRPFVGNKLTVANTIALAKISPQEKQLELANVIIRTRTPGAGGFGGGAWGRMEDGRFAPKTRVTTFHQCTCGCGNVHRDIRFELEVDPSEGRVGVETVVGTTLKSSRQGDTFHIQNPKRPGYSICGYELGARWTVQLPEHFDTRSFKIDSSPFCDSCARVWRKD